MLKSPPKGCDPLEKKGSKKKSSYSTKNGFSFDQLNCGQDVWTFLDKPPVNVFAKLASLCLSAVVPLDIVFLSTQIFSIV